MTSNEALTVALVTLHEAFPDAALHEVRLEFRLGDRTGETHGAQRNWHDVSWRVQVNNESESGDSLDEAIKALRARLAQKEQVPALAERIASILREAPDEGFARHDVLNAVQALLDKERRER